jgi:hypothetical protein
MELWLLVGALVLIALTVWIVWSPQRPRDAEELPMNDLNRSTIPPQGDKFEDQYTSATADLSAGGVATAREIASNASSAVTPPVERASATASEAWSSATSSGRDATTQPWSAGGTMNIDSTDGQHGMLPGKRTMGVGATAFVAVAGGVAGAWFYQRWQRKQNSRINRLRRGAKGLAGRLSERIPETDLPGATAPLGGAGAAVLLSSLVIARALRRESPPTIETRVEQGRGIVQTAFDFGREEAFRRLQVVILKKALDEARKRGKDLPVAHVPEETAKRGGIGLGGLLLIGGIGFVIVRMLRGGRGVEHAPAG